MNDFDQFERRLAAALRSDADLSVAAFEPGSIARAAIAGAQRRASRPARWFGRGRGLPLFAAAALLLVGGALAAGSGLVRLPSLVPPEPAPSLAVVASPSPAAESPSPAMTKAPAPLATPIAVQPKPGMFAYIRPSGLAGLLTRADQLWVANADGTGARRLARDLGGSLGAPAWSPDGTRLVFSRDEMDGIGYPAGSPRLYLTDSSGSAPQLVDTGCVAPSCQGDSDAAFSNDGTRLVFVRSRLGPPAPSSVLATIDLSTGRVTELASTTLVDCPMLPGQRRPDTPNCGGFADHNPRWSPDGTQIVFAQDIPNDINSGRKINGEDAPVWPLSLLFVVDADGGNLHQFSGAGELGDWSPDGTRIVFESPHRPSRSSIPARARDTRWGRTSTSTRPGRMGPICAG